MGKLKEYIKTNLILLMSIVSLCSNAQKCDNEKLGVCDYQFVYIADTITIKSPILLVYKNWHYVLSEDLLKKHPINSKLFKRTDVYILAEDGDVMIDKDHFKAVPNYYYEQLAFDYNEKNLMQILNNKRRHYSVYKFTCSNIKFYLTLMNLSMLNHDYCCWLDGPKRKPIKQKNSINTYYKVVYPFCE